MSVQRDGRRLLGSRPGRLRLAAIAVVVAILAAGVLGFIAASGVIGNTTRVEDSTGPVLVGTQELLASLAEADAAATAVHLSGQLGDREQRALYERALARASTSLERVARLVGDDEASHANMESIAQSLTQYAGIIERSRVMNEEGIPGADVELERAIEVGRDISADVSEVTERVQARLDTEIGEGLFYWAMGLYFVALIILVLAMVYLATRFRRFLNPPLFLAAVVTIAVAGWFGYSYFNQQAALNNARDGGYEAIELTSQIQSRAFRYKADESLALIAGNANLDRAGRSVLANELSRQDPNSDRRIGLLHDLVVVADSPRETAAARALTTRWDAYRATSSSIEDASEQGLRIEAISIATGASTSAFNGFNTQVESVLADNQMQFDAEVQQAGEALSWLRWVVVIGAVLAAFFAWTGFALRIREYQ